MVSLDWLRFWGTRASWHAQTGRASCAWFAKSMPPKIRLIAEVIDLTTSAIAAHTSALPPPPHASLHTNCSAYPVSSGPKQRDILKTLTSILWMSGLHLRSDCRRPGTWRVGVPVGRTKTYFSYTLPLHFTSIYILFTYKNWHIRQILLIYCVYIWFCECMCWRGSVWHQRYHDGKYYTIFLWKMWLLSQHFSNFGLWLPECKVNKLCEISDKF